MIISKKILRKVIKESINENLGILSLLMTQAGKSGKDLKKTLNVKDITDEDIEKVLIAPIMGEKTENSFKKWCKSNEEKFKQFIKDPNPSLVFDGYQLKIISNGKEIINLPAGSGYTGGYAQLPITKDKTKQSVIKNKGPTPPGDYTIEEMQVSGKTPRGQNWLSNLAWYGRGMLKKLPGTSRMMSGFGSVKWSVFAKSAWGNYRALLKPATEKQVTFYEKESGKKYKRGSMYIHGGAKQQSAGCIDLASNDGDGMEIFGPLYSLWYVKNKKPMTLKVKYDD
jgi:hypothetical protein